MRTITWLHLSDWHQKTPAEGGSDDREKVFKKSIEEIKTRKRIDIRLEKIDFIVFSGDLAFSGKNEQYLLAEINFLNKIKEVTGVKEDKIFFVPGNHDLDGDKLDEINKIKNDYIDKSIFECNKHDIDAWNDECRNDSGFITLLRYPFSKFRDFASRYSKQRDADFVSYKKLFIEGSSIGLFGLNSAIMSRRNTAEIDGKTTVVPDKKEGLILGTLQMEKASELRDKYKNDVNIVVFHHPIDWLNEFEIKILKNDLYNNFDFMLCGHTHEHIEPPTQYGEGKCIILNAGSAYEKDWVNSYNYCHLNLVSREATLFQRVWDVDYQTWKPKPGPGQNGILSENPIFKLRKIEKPEPPVKLEYEQKKSQERHFEKLTNAILEGSIIPVLGADINLAGRSDSFPWNWAHIGDYPPSNLEFTAYIEKKLGNSSIHCPFCQNEVDNFPPQECPLKTKYNISHVDLPYLTQNIWARYDNNERTELQDAIKSLYSKKYKGNIVHHFIKQIFLGSYVKNDKQGLNKRKDKVYPLIITTCIDDTIEKICESADKPFGVVLYGGNKYWYKEFAYLDGCNEKTEVLPKCGYKPCLVPFNEAEHGLSRKPIIFRMFGTRAESNDDFNFTEDNFLDYMLQANTKKFIGTIMQPLNTGSLWFLGYNISYWYLRILLRNLKPSSNTNNWFAAQEKPSSFESKLWKELEVRKELEVSFYNNIDPNFKELETHNLELNGLKGLELYVKYIEKKVRGDIT
ncbi:MAG: metallophosphoesterase [Proteobacteria bacterium]|nr:metallophosphoesterase [Pseudomonadota bacterium]